jgi:hypothetical protein
MFGFQRVGDLAWAAGDMQARGFLLGGTSGRTATGSAARPGTCGRTPSELLFPHPLVR